MGSGKVQQSTIETLLQSVNVTLPPRVLISLPQGEAPSHELPENALLLP
jgi:hypothetical protein